MVNFSSQFLVASVSSPPRDAGLPGCWVAMVTEVLVLEQAAEQQPADLLHGVLRGEGDGRDQVVLLTAPLDLAQEILPGHRHNTHTPPPELHTLM